MRAAESSRVLIRPSDQQLYATPVRWRDYLDESLAKFDFGRVVNNIGKKKAFFFVNLEVSGLWVHEKWEQKTELLHKSIQFH